MKRKVRAPFLLLLAASSLAAQFGPFPGQYPPGQYPSGRNPGNSGPGIPLPSRGSRKNNKQEPAAEPVSRSYRGVIRKLDSNTFDLEAEDTRFLIIQISSATTKPADLKIGDGVDVVATEDKDEQFQAVSIKPDPEIARTIDANDQIEPEERTGPPPTILVRPSATTDADDPGPPKLKRGKPPERASSRESQEEATTASLTPPPAEEKPASANPRQVFIARAREVAASFLAGLPDYVCQEVITRYVSETRIPSWNVIDVVSAEVVYDQGKETYRNMTINGKASKKPPEESGAWSTGEFGTILAALFSPGTDATFKYVEDGTSSHLPAAIYDYSVDRLRSAWTIHVTSQYIVPAYKGSVWLDKQSAHALRIEMQAKDVPKEFPLVSTESAVDYDYITLGTPEKFLLPVRAEILSCNRGSNECERNVIEFRNYHKFEGESTIKFNDQ